jgi:hypothetical protein
MNRNWNRHVAGGFPILSAALLAAVGLPWEGALSGAAAQTSSDAASGVIVDYDALNALPGQPAPGPTSTSTAVPAGPAVPPGVPALAPPSAPSSVLAIVGRDGRPVTPIKLKKPDAQRGGQVAAVTPPEAPLEMPTHVPMPAPTPPAPAPGETADLPIQAPAVEQAPTAPAAATSPAPVAAAAAASVTETPAEDRAVEDPVVQETPAQVAPTEPPPAETQAGETAQAETPPPETAPAETPPAETPPAETPSAEAEAASDDSEEQPAEQAAAEPEVAPDNSQPAPPIPVGGIRIIFPVDLDEVPIEANAALDGLAAQMLADESMRIQIMCYSSGDEETESKARRKALARCINIRQYLFKKDVRTTRMDVRALGLKSEGQPADRVDIVPADS